MLLVCFLFFFFLRELAENALWFAFVFAVVFYGVGAEFRPPICSEACSKERIPCTLRVILCYVALNVLQTSKSCAPLPAFPRNQTLEPDRCRYNPFLPSSLRPSAVLNPSPRDPRLSNLPFSPRTPVRSISVPWAASRAG